MYEFVRDGGLYWWSPCITSMDDAMHTVSSSSVTLLQNLKLIIEGCGMKLQQQQVC